jgi:hypothetical protein
MFKKLEKSVEKIFTKPFSKKDSVKPVELGAALKNEMDNNSQTISEGRDIAPNKFIIQVNSVDFQKINSWGTDALKSELNEELTKYAAEQNFALSGQIEIIINENSEYNTGDFSISTEAKKGKIAPATSTTETHPIIIIDGKKYVLTYAKTILGRGKDADVIINEKNISRHHASITRTEKGYVLTDLDSTNGTFVEGNKINKAYLLNGNQFSVGTKSGLFQINQ